VLSDAPPEDLAIMANPAWQQINRISTAEALKQGSEGWADEGFALHKPWDFEPGNIKASVTWWHSDDDKNVPLSAARRGAARLRQLDLRLWHNEGHFAAVVHDKEIVQELLARST
jgi:pimeloyl-ACP methyl ester carboxylesterase